MIVNRESWQKIQEMDLAEASETGHLSQACLVQLLSHRVSNATALHLLIPLPSLPGPAQPTPVQLIQQTQLTQLTQYLRHPLGMFLQHIPHFDPSGQLDNN